MVVPGIRLYAAVVSLLLVALVAARTAGLALNRALVVAAIRATVQLTLISSVIALVVRHGVATAGFTGLMFAVATANSAARVRCRGRRWALAGPLAAGAGPVLAIILACGAVPPVNVAILPIVGIVIGGAMTATSVAGRRTLDELAARRGEYEAALALGLTERDAALEICRGTAAEALMPALDQTRTVGLVTLPGAFVGVLLGTGNPVSAGAAQVLVLIGLLAAEALAILVTVELVARQVIVRDG
jgi:putative ABC transport system permease protein